MHPCACGRRTPSCRSRGWQLVVPMAEAQLTKPVEELENKQVTQGDKIMSMSFSFPYHRTCQYLPQTQIYLIKCRIVRNPAALLAPPTSWIPEQWYSEDQPCSSLPQPCIAAWCHTHSADSLCVSSESGAFSKELLHCHTFNTYLSKKTKTKQKSPKKPKPKNTPTH